MNNEELKALELLRKIKPLYEHEQSMGSMANYEMLMEYLIDMAAIILKKYDEPRR